MRDPAIKDVYRQHQSGDEWAIVGISPTDKELQIVPVRRDSSSHAPMVGIDVDTKRFLAAHRFVGSILTDGRTHYEEPPVPAPRTPSFGVGDVVRLKCGGPPMVVADLADEHKVLCHWHDAEGHILDRWISTAVLITRTSDVPKSFNVWEVGECQ